MRSWAAISIRSVFRKRHSVHYPRGSDVGAVDESEEAAEYGIAVAKLPPTGVSPDASDAVGKDRPQGSPGHPQEPGAARHRILVHSMFEPVVWTDAELLPVLIALHGKVLYHANRRAGQSVLLSKRRFANRWTSAQLCHTAGLAVGTCGRRSGTCRVKAP